VTYDVAVVGLGIIGACSVHALTRTGARVVGVDAGIPGAGTSGSSVGWLNACNKEPEAESRVGVRPMPTDGHTIAGRIPGFANGWMIATHSGVTLGALLGRLIADEILRDTPSPMLAPFRPARFTASSAPLER
jgi:glycine/D-amino acid oxidase-like deaminating enzyme